MDKKRIPTFYLVVMVLIIGVILLFVFGAYFGRDNTHIVLPDEASTESTAQGTENLGEQVYVDITPQNVQNVIMTLDRAENYSRSITVKTLYNGGEGSSSITVNALDGYTRCDVRLGDGQMKHTVVGGGNTYIWYNSSTAIYSSESGSFSPDAEQRIMTYEDILALDKDSITSAGYQTVNDMNCIYVTAELAADGYTAEYWIDIASGLLAAANIMSDEQVVYAMSSGEINTASPERELFVLPDGTDLIANSN